MQQVNSPLPKDWKPPVNPNNPPLPKDWSPGGQQGNPPSLPPGTPSPSRKAPGSQAGGFTQTHEGTFATGTNLRIPTSVQEGMQEFQRQFPMASSGLRGGGGATPGPEGMIRQQGPMDMMSPATRKPSVPPLPGMQQPPQQGQYDPTRPQSPGNMPPAPTQQDVDRLNMDVRGGRFGSADRKAGMYQGYNESAYHEAYKQLEKARQSVMVDPRFSPEQRKQALERIMSRADELDQGFLAAEEFKTSPIGYDAPPPEQFAEIQTGVGMQPLQDGSFRNPDTGDIMPGVIAPNGQRIPVPRTQSEIDALPEGTRYLDPQTGEITMADGSQGGGGRASTGGRRSARGQKEQTPESVYAEFEKWNEDAPFSKEENLALEKIMRAMPLDDRREEIIAMAKSDPMAARDALEQMGVDVSMVDDARIAAFTRQRGERETKMKKVSEALGFKEEEKAKPAYDPNRYRTEVGTRGTMQIKRRGSDIAIPAVVGEDGQPRPAPVQPRQLADLEVDTEFVNIEKRENGDEVRMLPFSNETINLENFALSDAQRRVFAKEAGRIRARPPEEWKKFDDLLQKYQTVDEQWDPKNPSEKQKELRNLISDYYGELGAEGKAMMTMYIAHALGYRVDKNRAFTSTGFASDPKRGFQSGSAPSAPGTQTGNQDAPQPSAAAETSSQPSKSANYASTLELIAKTGFTYAGENSPEIDSYATGGYLMPSEFAGRSPEYKRQMQSAVAAMIEQGRKEGKNLTHYLQELANNTRIPKKKRTVMLYDMIVEMRDQMNATNPGFFTEEFNDPEYIKKRVENLETPGSGIQGSFGEQSFPTGGTPAGFDPVGPDILSPAERQRARSKEKIASENQFFGSPV